jgi:hypothetical protein
MLKSPTAVLALVFSCVFAVAVGAGEPPSSFFPATGNGNGNGNGGGGGAGGFDAQPAQVPLDPTADPPQSQVLPVLREYDRFQDKTSVRVEGIRPTITKGESRLFLTVTCSADGTAVATKPTKVKVEVLAVSDSYQYADLKDGLQLIFLLTGEPAAPATAPVAAVAATNVPMPRVMPVGVGGASTALGPVGSPNTR